MSERWANIVGLESIATKSTPASEKADEASEGQKGRESETSEQSILRDALATLSKNTRPRYAAVNPLIVTPDRDDAA